VLRQGGLKSGDIVHDINGRRIYTVLQAVGAYLALRTEPELTLNVTRRGKPVILNYTVEQPKRKAKRNAKK
jgi:S1-C subfamily serine protease